MAQFLTGFFNPRQELTHISDGSGVACGLTFRQTILCWGDGSDGQTAPPAGRFTQVAMGEGFGCALRSNGSVSCWPRTPGPQDPWSSGYPTPPAPPGPFIQIAASNQNACGLKPNGWIHCWFADDELIPPGLYGWAGELTKHSTAVAGGSHS